MIDSILNLLFRCAHRRLTRPLTRMRKPGEPQGETYVVCLDCGRHFSYDWANMRMGKPIPVSEEDSILHPGTGTPRASKVKYAAVAASALPLGYILAGVLKKKKDGGGEPPPK